MMGTFLVALLGLIVATILGYLLAWWSRGDKIEYWRGLFEQKEVDYNTLDGEYHTTHKKVKGLEQDVRMHSAKVAPLNDEISALKSDVNNRDEIIANFKEQDWESKYNSAKFDVDKHADDLVKLRASVDPLNTEIEQLKKKHSTSEASVQDLKKQLEEWRKKYDNVTPDLKTAKDEAGELKIKMVSKDSYIEELKAKVSAANAAGTANVDLQNQFNSLQSNFNALQPERDQYKNKASELETQFTELRTKTSNLEHTNGDLLKQLEEAKAKASSANGASEKLEQLRAEKAKISEDLNSCTSKSNTLKSELEAAKANAASAEDLAKAQADNKRLMEELAAAKANAASAEDLAKAQADNKRLMEELAAAKANAASAEDLAKAQADNKRLMDELQAAKANTSSADELAKAQAENRRLMGELQASKLKAAVPIPMPMSAPVAEPDLDEEDAKDETLVRIREKAKNIDFVRLGTAKRADKDDLKLIKGIGPYIEKKLNALGIYRFEQISRFNDEDIDKINDAIEFFPGRVRRDDWKGQAVGLKG